MNPDTYNNDIEYTLADVIRIKNAFLSLCRDFENIIPIDDQRDEIIFYTNRFTNRYIIQRRYTDAYKRFEQGIELLSQLHPGRRAFGKGGMIVKI